MSDAFILLGDALWLDFINTAQGRIPDPPDHLPDSAGFAHWCEAQGLDPAAVPLDEIHAVRTHLTELADALHAGRHPAGTVIATLNRYLARLPGTQRLTRLGGAWSLQFAPDRPPAALEAIARSAAMTLASSDVVVRRCASERCSLFFTDATVTGHRRWCDLSACGRDARVERRRGARR